MPLTESEEMKLKELTEKQSKPLTNDELSRMQLNVEALYEYQEAFGALMVWNRFSKLLGDLAKDNELLINEINRLKAGEK